MLSRAQEVQLDLHRVIEPAKNVDIIPAFFIIPTRFIVMDMDLVLIVSVEFWVQFWLENMI